MSDTSERSTFFQQQLLAWGLRHGRAFPWRSTSDPYRLLIAEMMLRRTQARQVAPVYEDFVRQYPTSQVLASAAEAEVERLLRPLGLPWRIPAFRQMAQRIVTEYGGNVPHDRAALLSLPGVGEYVADAVRCFAYNEPVALLDTNTVRVAGGLLREHEAQWGNDPVSQVLTLAAQGAEAVAGALRDGRLRWGGGTACDDAVVERSTFAAQRHGGYGDCDAY